MTFIYGCIVDFIVLSYRGLLLSTFWKWFVMPLFPSAPALGIVASIGLSLMAFVLLGGKINAEDDRGIRYHFIEGVVDTTVFFILGFVVKQFL